MITVTRKLEFDYGHRVLGHEGKCRHLHGHRGVAEVTVEAPSLDSVGRVIDFGAIKTLVGGWIDRHWDHNFLCHPEDPVAVISRCARVDLVPYDPDARPDSITGRLQFFGGKPPYVMRTGNPTAENMAEELFSVARDLLPEAMRIVSVVVWETPSCRAEYRPDSR